MFKVTKKECKLPGFIRTNHLRQYWKSSTDFDKYLEDVITLRDGAKSQQSREIWTHFQFKFSMTYGE